MRRKIFTAEARRRKGGAENQNNIWPIFFISYLLVIPNQPALQSAVPPDSREHLGPTKKVLFERSNQIISCLCAYFASLRLCGLEFFTPELVGAKAQSRRRDQKNIWPIFFIKYFLVDPKGNAFLQFP